MTGPQSYSPAPAPRQDESDYTQAQNEQTDERPDGNNPSNEPRSVYHPDGMTAKRPHTRQPYHPDGRDPGATVKNEAAPRFLRSFRTGRTPGQDGKKK